MCVLGLGVDLVEVERVRAALVRFGDRFTAKILTPSERQYCEAQKYPEVHIAARFAAKEAISKCFGTGLGWHLGWHDIEIARSDLGAPEVFLSKNAEGLLRERAASKVLISMSHTKNCAVANAVLI
jgi:holo-[acyl-carrier protein] synthase